MKRNERDFDERDARGEMPEDLGERDARGECMSRAWVSEMPEANVELKDARAVHGIEGSHVVVRSSPMHEIG